ncbi:hypothetical protein JKF63_01978 [Porcisia hertigi]|uniref:Uncharacterized protein n=1 Tax=Porcisia hertigi TaxID=2761500 RepID=A0A836IGS1_9TRYP|nr:hypothetical protein JKF63_01978 [Porcisia hertigi]
MPVKASHVKQLLSTARIYRRPDMLCNIVREVQVAETSTGTSSAELRLLCAEVSVELKQWSIAAELLKGIGTAQETRILTVRRVFCEVLVSLHHVDENATLSEEEKVQEYVGGAARALQALAEAVQLWPDSLDAVLTGVRTLWLIVSPLLTAGHEADVCDTVAFLATLHQQLHIGGGYTLVQWLVRAALCFRIAERPQDAVVRFAAALEAAALMGNQRLFVQVLRVAAGSIFLKEKNSGSSKTRSDLLPSYRNRPVLFAALLTYLVLGGLIEMDACKEDLQSVYCTLREGVEAAPPPPPEAGAPVSRGRKKQLAARPSAVIRLVDSFAVTESDIIDEVKTDVLFCISLHGTLSPDQVEELERKRYSANRRVRSFAAFALVVRGSRRHGFNRLAKCADASSVSAAHRAELRPLVKELVDVLKNTNTIHDDSERQYTLRVGASLLWNLVLPFLQTGTLDDVRVALSVLTDVSQASIPALRKLFLQAGTQQCQLAYDEDNRSALHQLLPLLQREFERGEAYKAAPLWSFQLQWLQRQTEIRDELEGSLTSGQDRCLFAIEQARWISNPLKRMALIKTAFRFLPPVVQESDSPQTTTEATDAQKGASARGNPTTRRSTIQLYRELLELCMQDLSPSLYAVAMAVAEALRALPCPLPNAGDVDTEEVRAIASLHAATISLRHLEELDVHRGPKEAPSVMLADAGVAAAGDREGRLSALLVEAAQRGSELENRRSGSGGWITANACVTFLTWKRALYARGEYRPHLQQLLELQQLYTAQFEHDQVQDAELLSDITTSSVLGLVAESLEKAKHPIESVTSSLPKNIGADGFAALVQYVRTCGVCEPSNAQLRRAHTMCLEALRMIPIVKQKWFLAVLSPALARLVGDKATLMLHPQEQLLVLLGVLAGPSAIPDKRALVLNDARALLRKDPCVRLCASLAAVAVQLRLEEVALECCEIADKLYASNRLGWGSLFELQPSPPLSASVSAAFGKTMDSSTHKKISLVQTVAQLEALPTFPKPDAEDWEAYSELLSIKARLRAQHLHGLNSDVRNRAVQLLLTNCVNSAIAAVQGPAASRVAHITNAYNLYYHFLRTSRVSLKTAKFLLPSLRMLLSKALLAQLPKRSWSESFIDVVYQLSCVLVYVSFSSGQEDDVCRLAELLRPLRDLLPPRYQKTLRAWEMTEVCYRNPTIEDFLQRSKNVEAELQVRGWIIVAQSSRNASQEGEAFALALAASQGSPLLRAQCLFEHAYAATLQRGDSTSLAQVTTPLQEALRILEGLPEAAPILQSGEEVQRWHATLAEASLTASFLSSQAQRRRLLHNDDLTSDVAVATATERPVATLKSTRKTNTTKVMGVTFHHAFLGLHIVSLLFRMTPDYTVSEVRTTSLKSVKRTTTPASRRDCANVMLDYILCLWQLSATWLLDGASSEDDLVLKLPVTPSLYYGHAEATTAAQRLRCCVPDEEFCLNTEGLWQCLLDLGDYLTRTGNEARAFMVYSWVRFAAVLAFGDAKDDARSGLVQRLCNWKMCVAAATCGLCDSPYVAALSRLGDAKALVEEAVQRDVESKSVSPSWEAVMVVSECEIRAHLGQTEEAATLADDVLCRGLECVSWNTAATRARALRVRARHEAICSRYRDSLRTLQQALDLIGATEPTPTPSIISVRLWVDLCGDRLDALMSAQSTTEAVQWVGSVRERLRQWHAAAAAASRQADTVHAACVLVEVKEGLEFWASRLFTTVAQQLPLTGEISCPPTYPFQAQLHAAAGVLLREIPLVTEGCPTLLSRLYTMHAQWHARDRVTPHWLAQHGANVDVARARFLLLLAELRALDELSHQLQTAYTLPEVGPDSPTQGDVSAAVATSMAFWQGSISYCTAINRLEASQLASCLLNAFRRLSMEDLGLPTSNAPARCEREVLKLFRGAAVSSSPAITTAGREPEAVSEATAIGARWHTDFGDESEEFQQALQHYSVTDSNAASMLAVSSVPALLEKAASHCRRWPHTRLAAAILVAVTQVQVLQRVEDKLERCEDLVDEKLQAGAQAVVTAAWNRTRIVQPRVDKPGGRTRKSVTALKTSTQSETDLETLPREMTEEEETLVARISSGIEMCVRHCHFDMAAQLSGVLSHLAVFWDRSEMAAAASEQTQTSQLVGLLWRSCVGDMIDCPEGRLWRQMRAVPPLFRNSTFYKQLADQVISTTPMVRSLRSCSVLCVVQGRNAVVPAPPPSPKGSNAIEVSPYAIDSAVLSVSMDSSGSGFCIVTLRHPDGVVEGRRKCVPRKSWEKLADTLQSMETRKLKRLGSADSVSVGSSEERVTAEDVAGALGDLNAVAVELFGDFQPSLHLYCEKSSLYLCLAPELQPFPWEQTGVLSCCSVVLRELGAAVVISKMGAPQRPGKRITHQAPKQSGPTSTKNSTLDPVVSFIDMFGDHPESIATTFGADLSKSKVSLQFLMTCSSVGVPPDASYLTWMLRDAAPGSLVVNMCGSLSDVMPWSYLASLSFTQLNSAILADGASNRSSQQREERLRLSLSATRKGQAPSASLYPRWMVHTLLLLRGAKFVAANAFTCSPSVTDALARRCLTSTSSGKAVVEQLRGKSKDSKVPFVTLYGVLSGVPSKGKT